ncbi:MAG: cadherin-like domain-containing protein [Acidimicrobiales bacterium]
MAEANISGLFASNDAADILVDTFRSDEALFAYVVTDIVGGEVCIVDATVEDPAAASCDDPAWGSPNRVFGIGTLHTLLEGPGLAPGTWKLLGTMPNGAPGGRVLSAPFTVVPCGATCNYELGAAAAEAFKAPARQLAAGTKAACIGFGVADWVGGGVDASEYWGMAKTLRGTVDDTAGAVSASASRSPGGGTVLAVGAAAFGPVLLGLPMSYNEAVIDIGKQLLCAQNEMFTDIVNDPPRADYTVLHEPRPRPIAETYNALGNEFVDSLEATLAVDRGMLITYERYLGAVLAGNAEWTRRQAQHLHTLSLAAGDAMRASAAKLAEVSAALGANPEPLAPMLTEAELVELKALANRVATAGLLPEELASFAAAGATEAERDRVVAEIVALGSTPDADFPVGRSLVDIVDALAAELRSASYEFERFGRFAFAGPGAAAAVNRAPVAGPDNVTTSEDADVAVSVLDNDVDPDGDALTLLAVSPPTRGSAALLGNRVIYTPAPDSSGADSFTYTISDGNGQTATAAVLVTVTPLPDTPVARDDDVLGSVGVASLVDVLANDADADGEPLVVTVLTPPASGLLEPVSNGVFRFTPARRGAASFTYLVTDPTGRTATATVRIASGNTAPVALDDVAATDEDIAVTVDVLANDADADGDPLTISITSASRGLPVVNGDRILYVPAPDYAGADSFTYQVSDGVGRRPRPR